MSMRNAGLFSILFIAAACSSGVTESGGDVAGDVSDVDVLKEVVQPETVIFPDQKPVDAGKEVFPDVTVDLVPDIPVLDCDPGEGCFMDKCSENGDCQSNWCVEHLGEGVCTQTCQEECPAGWKCKQVGGTEPDVIFICVSDYANLCKPCEDNDDCGSTGGAEDVCVDYGAEGSFCGGQCEVDGDCPWGFSCENVVTVDGIDTTQCINDAGVCPCTHKSVALSLFTPCAETNDWGTCTGKRICMEEGLTECNAVVPEEETCNGLDDDCDEETDEPPLVEGEYGNLCSDDNDCTEDKCKGEDGCENLPTDGAECVDGDPCTMADHCVQDVCVGTPVECKDDNPCTDDGCDDTGGCTFTPNDDACDDGNPCTVGDQCKETECMGTELPCDCQVDEDCTELEDGNVCNGSLACNTDTLPYKCEVDAETIIECDPPEDIPDAVCQQAHCVPETGECQVIPANEGFACDDANACTAGDKCVEGACASGIEINCADDNPCTDDSCDVTDGCVQTSNEAPCSDGSVCTVNDTCSDSQCTPGVDLDCNDNNPCTTDSCAPAAGCAHEPVDESCDDGNACSVGDHCEAGVCVFDSVDSCDDGNPCTSDSCDPVQGCVSDNVAGPCSDNDPCTLNDLCVDGQCTSGAPMNCNDGNPCTEDKCNELGACAYSPVDGLCDDGNACTEGDHCGGGECVHDGLKECDDFNVCTTDVCDPLNGCTYSTNDNVCSDGSVCTVGDQCVDGLCVPGDGVECDDGNECTDDVCDKELGCVFTLNEALCDDGDVCTDGDACSQGVCGGTPCFDQGLYCSKDGCADKVCSSLAFDGDEDFVTVPHSPLLNLDDTSYTVEAWFWFEEYSPLWVSVILSKFAGSGATRLGWVLMVGGEPSGIGPGSLAGGHYYGEGVEPVAKAFATPEQAVPTLQWVHGAVTFDKDTQTGRVWLNGELAGEVVAEPPPPTNFDLHIGSMRPSPCPNCYYWDGFIDEVRISSTIRYTEDFQPAAQLMPDNATLALWDFNEGQGGIAHDTSGNGHDGVITDASWAIHGPADGCCVPQCEGKECGDDGCGGSCGDCGPLETCSTTSTGTACIAAVATIPSGTFWMGCNNCPGTTVQDPSCAKDEHSYHLVQLDSYQIDLTEVTAEQYVSCVAADACTAAGTDKPGCTWEKEGLGQHPANCINWPQAEGYCEWAGKRLCTEAEWEKAARGGCEKYGDPDSCKADSRKYPWGNEAPTCDHAVIASCGTETQPVCSKSPIGDSPYGLCDMAGNVWERLADHYQEDYYCEGELADGVDDCETCGAWPGWPAAWSNPAGPEEGLGRTVRGGRYGNVDPAYFRVSNRDYGPSELGTSDGVGVRCCRTLPQDCVPDCEGKECGDDGCGDTCGECASPSECVGGVCSGNLWSKRFGGVGWDESHAIAADSKGNVYVGGSFSSLSITFGGSTLWTAGLSDAFLAKFDSQGDHLWSKRFGGNHYDSITGIAIDAVDNVYLAGNFQSPSINLGGGALYNYGDTDIFVAKLSAGGNLLWSKRFGGSAHDGTYGLAVTPAGKVYFAGYFKSNSMKLGTQTIHNKGSADVFVAKFAGDGTPIWSRSYGGAKAEYCYAAAVDSFGNAYLTGQFESQPIDFGGEPLPNAGEPDIYLAKLDSDGIHLWSHGFGGVEHDTGNSVATDANGNAYLAGQFRSTSVDFGGGPLGGSTNPDMFLAKFDADGSAIWSTAFFGENWDAAHGVAVGPDGRIWLVGNSSSDSISFGGDSLQTKGGHDVSLARFFSDGNHDWSDRFGGSGYDQGESVAVGPSSSAFIIGRYDSADISFGGEDLQCAGSYDIFLAKFK